MASADRRGWYVISLRPQGGHDALRAAAARRGAGLLALSPWRLQGSDDAGARARLHDALACQRIVFTSPAAVRFAAALAPLRRRRGQAWIAVGTGTAAALRRAGIDEVSTPLRMDSEGVLALPALRELRGARTGLVTAPAGRDLLAQALCGRGADLHRADVYRRVAVALPAAAARRLQALPGPACVLLSSGEALARVLAQLPAAARRRLLRADAIAASDRLAAQARDAGFVRVHRAAGPRPSQLLVAAVNAVGSGLH